MKRLAFLVLIASCARVAAPPNPIEIYTAGAHENDRLPLIVALHGYGDTNENIAHLLDGLGVRARVMAPHGLFSVDKGWGWFARDWKTPDEIAPGITHAADVIAQQIAAEVRTRPTCGSPIVVGFSQGGFLSYALAARMPAVVGTALPISGFLPASLRPVKAPADAAQIFSFHGEADQTVPLTLEKETTMAFGAAGYRLARNLYPGVGHTIPAGEQAEIRATIEQVIREEGCAK